MVNNYFVVDIETVPNDIEKYMSLDEESRKELLNPIDSKIVAIGIRSDGTNKIFIGEDEKRLLEDFWKEWGMLSRKNPMMKAVGFNILSFDIPFLTARSFIHNIRVVPFVLKNIIDLRDKINAYRYGKTRGKLKEYAELLNIETMGIDGSEIAPLWQEGKIDILKKYLENDLMITDSLYKRAVETNIININRW